MKLQLPNVTLIDLDGERWKDVIGLDGMYQISDKSRFRRLARIYVDVNGRQQNLRAKILRTWICRSTGYKMIQFGYKCVTYKNTTHRLLGIHFIQNPENKPEINHKNGLRWDDRLENLEWATSSEQKLHAYRVLKRKPPTPYSKNPALKVNRQGSNSKKAIKVKQLDLLTGVVLKVHDAIVCALTSGDAKCKSAVTKCCKGKIKFHNNYKWEYA